jgi:hypothetical protein
MISSENLLISEYIRRYYMKVLVKNGKTTGISAKLWECHELNFAKKSDEYICRFENNEKTIEAGLLPG